MRLIVYLLVFLLVFVTAPLLLVQLPESDKDWRSADRRSANIAPLPWKEREAVVQLYAARAFQWRGRIAVHSWIATKERDAAYYTVYQVIGFNARNNLPVVSIKRDIPDRKWYDRTPEILDDIRGKQAERMIPQIRKAAENYPYQKHYRLWPGPNSNSFIAEIMRQVSGFYVELPPHALGKDWLPDHRLFARSTTRTGFTLSLYGVLGLTLGWLEGIELHILGLTYGVDIIRPALKMPFIGRIGMPDRGVDKEKLMEERSATERSSYSGR